MRLKEVPEYIGSSSQWMFQFQIGAIKSLFAGCCFAKLRGFNSRLVRLKGNARLIDTAIKALFQFQIGAIKSGTLLLPSEY